MIVAWHVLGCGGGGAAFIAELIGLTRAANRAHCVEPSRPEPRLSTNAYDDKRNRQTPGGQVRRVTRPSAISTRAPPSHQRAYVSRIFIPAAAAAAVDDDVRTKSSQSYNLYNSKQRSVKYCNAVKDTSKDEHLLAFVRIGFESIG